MRIEKKRYEKDYVPGAQPLDLYEPHCERCDWKGTPATSPGAALKEASKEHDNFKCLNPQEQGAA